MVNEYQEVQLKNILMSEFSILEKIIVWAIPVLFAITVHEVAHGWVADQLGDPTAKTLGRLTLNPIKHIDLVGTVILPLLLLFIGNFIFGWAKPVPVTWKNLGHPRRDMALVALAGPFANLLMMFIWAILAKLVFTFGNEPTLIMQLFITMCGIGIVVNVVLMVLNLLPVLPLDGGRIVSALLPVTWSRTFARLEPFGLIIIVALLATGYLFKILGPIVDYLYNYIYQLI